MPYPAEAVSSRLHSYPSFRNVLYATDFSPCSESALASALAVAGLYGSTVHLLHVIGPKPTVGPLGVPFADITAENAAAQQRMDELRAALGDVLYTITLQRGAILDVIERLAADLHIDLIVMGTHGRRGLKHFVLGSVAEQVFRRANCPVLTVGPEANIKLAEQGGNGTVLYATDFSVASLHALDYAISLARAQNAKLALVHALTGSEIQAKFVEDAEESARRQLHELMPDDAHITCDAIVECGPATDMILKAARDTNADVIVMGAHHGASASAHMPWATAHRVLCYASCPVMTVRGS